MTSTAQPNNGLAPPVSAPSAPDPGARQRCTGCESNRDLANWPRDKKGVLRKTCIKCKEKRARHKEKKWQIEKAANADNDNDETVSAGEKEENEDVDGTERDARADEGEEDAKPAVVKELLQRMMVDEINAEEAEIVGRDFFDRVAAMVAEDA